MSTTPEAVARIAIDAALERAGWAVQDRAALNLYAARGVAVREFSLPGHGEADYLLFADGDPVGAVEAKPVGHTLTGVEIQSAKYGAGLPPELDAPVRPLPFLYETTGVETQFTNRLDPDPRSRRLFAFHRPETLAAWVAAVAPTPPQNGRLAAEERPPYDLRPTFRGRLRAMPPLNPTGLWPAQRQAVENLERSLAADRPRALIQMATGSGKTFTAISSIYRLIKFGGAERVLFLVDRANLGKQALREFQGYVTPDDGRKFTELYNVQRLTSNTIDPVSKVVITTIQRLYAMLQGEAEFDPAADETSLFDAPPLPREPLPVAYNPDLPIEFFDVIFTDECHRSIYNLWRQVLEYFDASLVGLTATPSTQTLGFFKQNLVMEYGHEQAVADGVNVDFDVYQIRTRITEGGSVVEADYWVDRRDRATRARRLERLDDDFAYAAKDLDRAVVAEDQIRTVVRTFKEKLFTEIFPGRNEVPKTLIFAKDDSHADDIVQIVREEFGRGNEFAQKITYRTTGVSPEQLIKEFRTDYYPRIAVTVDMIATGTDIKPLEIVMFLRSVKSPNFFEQMKGRGVRVINDTDFQVVTPGGHAKTHFVLIDCVGVTEQEFHDAQTLERQKHVPLKRLLEAVALNRVDPDLVSSLAARLARLDRRLDPAARATLAETAPGHPLPALVAGLVAALDSDAQLAAARTAAGLPPDAEPPPDALALATKRLLREAVKPLAANPALRQAILDAQRRADQTIDTVSQDDLLHAGFSQDARDRAGALVASWETFIAEHKDELTALEILYGQPYAARLRFADLKALARAIQTPPRAWTADALWRAYETLDQGKVRGSAGTQLTNLVALVRYALRQDDELVPYPEQVATRYAAWLAQQEAGGRRFTPDQRRWLNLIRDHVAASLRIDPTDFDYAPFAQEGGLGRVHQLFGDDLDGLLAELNEVLVA